jgi:hypothetical protein
MHRILKALTLTTLLSAGGVLGIGATPAKANGHHGGGYGGSPHGGHGGGYGGHRGGYGGHRGGYGGGYRPSTGCNSYPYPIPYPQYPPVCNPSPCPPTDPQYPQYPPVCNPSPCPPTDPQYPQYPPVCNPSPCPPTYPQ